MTGFNFFETLGSYAPGVVLVACLVVVSMTVLRRTILKGKGGALVALLPFFLGILFYAVYYCITMLSFEVFLQNFEIVLQTGLATGALSTAVNAVITYLTSKTSLTGNALLVYETVKEFAASASADNAETEALAKQIAAALSENYGDEEAKKAEEILLAFCAEHNFTVTDAQVGVLVKLIIVTLQTNKR